jgi:hypothetical protein
MYILCHSTSFGSAQRARFAIEAQSDEHLMVWGRPLPGFSVSWWPQNQSMRVPPHTSFLLDLAAGQRHRNPDQRALRDLGLYGKCAPEAIVNLAFSPPSKLVKIDGLYLRIGTRVIHCNY